MNVSVMSTHGLIVHARVQSVKILPGILVNVILSALVHRDATGQVGYVDAKHVELIRIHSFSQTVWKLVPPLPDFRSGILAQFSITANI